MSSPESTRPRLPWLLIGSILVFCAVVAGIVVTTVSRTQTADAVSSVADDGTISVTAGFEDCGAGWTDPQGGALSFDVSNSTIAGEDVYLEDAGSGAIYGEVEGLGTNASHSLKVVLGDGSYRFVCIPFENDPVYGAVVTIAGAPNRADQTRAIQLITSADLIPAAKQYQAWIAGRLPVLAQDARALADAVAAGDVESAKSAWLTTHLEYETLGAAYGAFGDSDAAINGIPASGATAVDDPDLTGLHKIEALLWGGHAAPEIVPVANRLVSDIDSLQIAFGTARIDPLDIGLRSHEILENAIQFELTGETDAGSETNIATIGANLVGTRQALEPLEGLLSSRYPELGKTKDWLDRSAALVASYQRPDGSWTPLGELTHSERATLDSTLDQTVELLAPIAAICDPRTTAQ